MVAPTIILEDDPRLENGEQVLLELSPPAGQPMDEDRIAGWIFTDRRILRISALGGAVLDEIAWNNIAEIIPFEGESDVLMLVRRIEKLSDGSFTLFLGTQGDAVRAVLSTHAWCEVHP